MAWARFTRYNRFFLSIKPFKTFEGFNGFVFEFLLGLASYENSTSHKPMQNIKFSAMQTKKFECVSDT